MILLDANLLLFAYVPESAEHDAARTWVEELLSEIEPVAIPWVTVWAFLRIGTNPGVFERPFSPAEALDAISGWLAQPVVTTPGPGPHHHEILDRMIREGQATGPLVTDAVLAALAIEHGCTLASTDRDFARFPGLRWFNPLAAS